MRYGRLPPKGMGGWLALLFSLLCINAMLTLLVLIYPIFSPNDGMSVAEIIGFAVVSATLAAILFFRREPSTPSIVVSGLWLMALYGLVWSVLASWHVQVPGPIGVVVAARSALEWSLVHPLINATVWSAYLMRSKRVATTYHRVHEPNLAEVFR